MENIANKAKKYLLHLNGEFVPVTAYDVTEKGYLLDEEGLPLINLTIEGAEEVANVIRSQKPSGTEYIIFDEHEAQKYFLRKPSEMVVAQKLLDGDYNFSKGEANYLITNSKYLYNQGHHSLIEALYQYVPENPLWRNYKFQRFAGYNEFHNAVLENDVNAIQPFIEGMLPLPSSALNKDGFVVLQDAAVKHNNEVLHSVFEAFKGKPYFMSMLRKVMVAAVVSDNVEIVEAVLSHAQDVQSKTYNNYAESLVASLGIKSFAEKHEQAQIYELASRYIDNTDKESRPDELKNFFRQLHDLQVERKNIVSPKSLGFSSDVIDLVEIPVSSPHPNFNQDVFDAIYPAMKLAYEIEGRMAHYGVEAAYKMAVIYDTPESALGGVVGVMQGYAARGVGSSLVFNVPGENKWTPEVWRELLKTYGKKATAVVEDAAFIERIVNSRPEEYNLEEVLEFCCQHGSAKQFYRAEAEKKIRALPEVFDRAAWVEVSGDNPKMALAALNNEAFTYINELNSIRFELDLPEKSLAEIDSGDIKLLYFLSTMEQSPELKQNPKLMEMVKAIMTAEINAGGLETLKSPITIGVELEYHGVKNQHLEELNVLIELIQEGWKQTLDSSVMPEDKSLGLESVSDVLTQKDVKFIHPVVEIINALGGEVSGACALHVHAGIMESFADQETRLNVVKQAIINYATLEQKLGFMDNDLTYPYRQVFNDQDLAVVEGIEAIMGATDFQELTEIAQPEGRRRARINLMPLSSFGTIEFRQHPGSTAPSEVTAWVKFIDNFMHESIQMAMGSQGAHMPDRIEQIKLEKCVDDYLRDRRGSGVSANTSILEAGGSIVNNLMQRA